MQIKQTGIPGIRFFTVIFTHTTEFSHVSCRVILTCAKIRFALQLDLR